ncbi:TonB-dependent receptor [Maribacter sp. ANRC-HE7]|uniref:TonB-dependent receptor n=1 Tax=Maribacter aquimaris TaxID=2737171 RepID=A0ABR7V018_9FLAO|nr:TonB-dependent receptor [Maribacter aquimaris]MBD0777847.1 TonB-dependent receptor [Maribacter aquimaris]
MQKKYWFSNLLENITSKNRTMKISILLFAFALFNLQANASYSDIKEDIQQSVSGTVIDESGMPIPGVSVVVKGTTNGVAADFDGNYTITVPGPESVLVFSFIGLVTEEVTVGNRQVINVTMKDDVQGLDEVVVIGYGTQKRSNLTGAISSIKSEDLNKVSVTRVDQALQGKAAGVMVSQASGKPGAAPTVNVRGVGSIGGTSPLWIVDGIRMETSNFFNANDVESIEILKDASASAIYGAQAAHGVVLVTTKRGASNNKTNINFKANTGISSPINLPTMLNRDQYIAAATASRAASGQLPEDSWSNVSGMADTNWSDELYSGSGIKQNYNLSISSGTDKANFYLSGNYDNEEGMMIDNEFERYSLRANSDFKLFDGKVKIGESVLLSRTIENPTYAANGIPWRSTPLMPVYDETNTYGGWGTGPSWYAGRNMVANEYQHHRKYTNNRINGNVYLEVDVLKGLKFRSTFGVNYTSWLGRYFDEAYNYGTNSNSVNSLTYASNNANTLTANYVLTYDKTIGDHSFKAMAGYEAVKGDGVGFNATKTGFTEDVSYSFATATGEASITDVNTIDKSYILSQFGRLNYGYKDKYLLEGTIRRDASSPKFGSNNLWGVFPSFSGAWRVSQEDFLKDNSLISNLKLRVSSGTLGSDNINNFLYSKSYHSTNSYYLFDSNGTNKVSGFFLSGFPNADVKWEEIKTTDIGIDLGLFNNKVSIVMDYYIKKTSDMLYAVTVPLSVGISKSHGSPEAVSMNIGEMKNTGFEFAVNYQETFNEFKLNISANTSFQKNELTKLTENAYINGGDGGQVLGSTTRSEVGHPLSSFYGYKYVKIIDSQSEIDALNAAAPNGLYQQSNTAPGDMLYEDINGDNQITDDDKTYLGNPWPKMIYGLTTNLEWRNLDFSLFLQGVQGVDVFNANKTLTQQIYADYNSSTEVLNAWTPDNQTNQPRLVQGDPNSNFANSSSYFVEDGSFLKVRNIQLGYTLPQSILSRFNMTNARVYISGENIMTFTKYSGIDPEVAGGSTSRGVDYDAYPQARTISVGVELSL